ncbi:hypothetical protein GLOIN_2v1783204 [Rhizophagus irregularis DAOM 181602=DAOM 197198]|nr:hypothetical protein GLOIN_2v1783204 [Rhizophagus irregularis DAOM 181602=DAOM 197198]
MTSGFLPPVVQGKDKHFLSLLHTLEYVNDRLPGYDMHCPSISSEIYDELEKENNTIPEVHAGEMSHTQHKYANVEANGNAKNDIHDGKYKRSGIKKSQPWEQDHLTFQI